MISTISVVTTATTRDLTTLDRLKTDLGIADAAQDAALADPVPYDADTEELLSWFSAEVVRLHGTKKEAA